MSPRSPLHLRFYSGMPLAILDTWVPSRLALPFLGSAVLSTSLYHVLLPHSRPCYQGKGSQHLELATHRPLAAPETPHWDRGPLCGQGPGKGW